MKKFATIILTIIFCISATGLSIAVHNCGGSESFSFLGVEFGKECKCDHSEKEHENVCCKDHVVFIKNVDSEKVAKKIYYSQKLTFIAFSSAHLLQEITLRSVLLIEVVSNNYYYSDANPPPLYILYESYLI